jgi:tRNA-dihydrouridine synthase B
MAGISDWPFRLLCFEHGCDRATTEMVSAMGYQYTKSASQVYRYLLAKHPDEGPVTVQIFGSDPKPMERIARELSGQGIFSGIDINMGCPAQKVVSSGSGCALMREPLFAAKIMTAVVKASALPVSVKLRIGWDADSINILELARVAQDCGIAFLTIHGRTRAQQYGGKADMDIIAQVANSVSLPVIANGDIASASEAKRVLQVTGCAGVSIGRGALGNPWIFEQVKAALRGDTETQPSFEQILQTSMCHADRMVAWKGESSAVLEMRKHFAWYIRGMRNAAQVRHHINTLKTMAEIKTALFSFARETGAQEHDN